MNIASRMETTASPMTIQVSHFTYNLMSNCEKEKFQAITKYIKGCGMMKTYVSISTPMKQNSSGNLSESQSNPLFIFDELVKLIRDD
jgi:hypothetical protein